MFYSNRYPYEKVANLQMIKKHEEAYIHSSINKIVNTWKTTARFIKQNRGDLDDVERKQIPEKGENRDVYKLGFFKIRYRRNGTVNLRFGT